MPTALITGITGQDGSFLAEFLLSKGYKVYGLVRRSSTPSTSRIKHILDQITIIPGDLEDLTSVINAVKLSNCDEFYNLAAQSFVKESWMAPFSTSQITALGVINCLEAIRQINPKIKFYQAGSSEQFGNIPDMPQNELTNFYPRSPYGCSKVFAYHMTKNWRESFGLHASIGLLFNHESERRGELFVTRKITKGIARIKLGLQNKIVLGNLDAKRDWGYAKDYVQAMWLMLQQKEPGDYVIGTGIAHSVRSFVIQAFKSAGMDIVFSGEGINEKGYANGKLVVEISEEYFRPAEVDHLLANPSKAKTILGWEPKTTFEELVKIMVLNDLEEEKAKHPQLGNAKIEPMQKPDPKQPAQLTNTYFPNSVLRNLIS